MEKHNSWFSFLGRARRGVGKELRYGKQLPDYKYHGDEEYDMKAIKKILIVHADDSSLGPIFKAIFQSELSADPTLATAGLQVDSVGIEGSDGEPLHYSVDSALKSMGVQEFEHTSKNIWLHQDLVRWADLILVPSLWEENILCLNFTAAWSKTLPVECYCGQYYAKIGFHPGTAPHTEDECRASADSFKKLLPDVINKLKDSYADALIARGINMYEGTVIGKAFIVKQAGDLERFEEANILVIDRPGAILYQSMDKAMATNIIKKFVESPVLPDNIKDLVIEFEASLKGKTKEASHKWLMDGGSAFSAVLRRAKALICCRGRHSGEILAKELKIPCISSCVGATECIATGQVIIVDAGRGEVYDAALLQNCN